MIESIGVEKENDELASSPGHSQILSLQLRDKIWEWPGARSCGEKSFFSTAAR